uniref:Protein S100-A11 n=2 Tax=Fundulus heteroclitus TaxID=8078 RepID=A0A146WT63_FUNHE
MLPLTAFSLSEKQVHLFDFHPIMESAIGVLVSQFKAYAGKDGSSDTLSRDEFQKLVKSELSNFVKNASDPAAIDQLMSSLDMDNDGELCFLEFWQLIGRLANKHGGFSQ